MQMLCVLFQHFLQMLEEVDVFLLIQVIAVDVGVFEDLSAPDHFVDCFLEELELAHGVLLEVVEHLDLLVNHRSQCLCVLLCLLVVYVPLEVEHVPIQLVLSLFSLPLLL